MSLIFQLKEYLKSDGGWISGAQLELIHWKKKNGYFFKPSNISRRLRELAEEGVLESQGNPVEYKYRGQMKRIVEYILEWDLQGNPVRRPVVKEILV